MKKIELKKSGLQEKWDNITINTKERRIINGFGIYKGTKHFDEEKDKHDEF